MFYCLLFRRLATTKFQPTDTRKALPCFDEPSMKATFSTVIVHDPDYRALSNMPVEKKKPLQNGRVASYFKKSVPMSTYLLAFIVCDFNYTEAKTGVHDNITVSGEHDVFDCSCYRSPAGLEPCRHWKVGLLGMFPHTNLKLKIRQLPFP